MSDARTFEKVCVVGLGYIGLPTAAMFASRQIKVIGVDVNAATVDTVNRGEIHIVEPDLDIVVRATVKDGWLSATMIPEQADAFLVAVPTPFVGEARTPDLSYIQSACKAIAPFLKPGDLVVLESTSPVGATEQMAEWMASARPDLTFPSPGSESCDVQVAHCPERVLPGRVMMELISNDRILGGLTPACAELAATLYRSFVTGQCFLTDARTAELAKLAENSFRDVNVAFANELSLICAHLGVNVWELIRLTNRHPRVEVLSPGPGVGGHCIAVDPWFIVASAPEQARLIRTAREVNDHKPGWVVDQVLNAVEACTMAPQGKSSDNVTILFWGLSFKANIDDLRESPAVDIVSRVASQHPGPIRIIEPHIKVLPSSLAGRARLCTDMKAMADIHVLLVDHSVFHEVDRPAGTLVDTKGMWG